MPQALSAKNKIIILAIIWLILSVVMFTFLFKIMDSKNQTALDDMAKDRQQLVLLQAENRSFKQAQVDLDKIAKQQIQPKDFFSTDITLVKEIQILEDLDGEFNTKVNFSGVSGIVTKGQSRAGTASPMFYVPYSIAVNGFLPDVLNLIEHFENLSFISKVTGFSMTSAGDGKVNANLGSGFYIENN